MLLWYIWNATLDNWTSQNICTESAMMIMMIYDGKLLDNYTSVLKNEQWRCQWRSFNQNLYAMTKNK